jgi:hypothetical protein
VERKVNGYAIGPNTATNPDFLGEAAKSSTADGIGGLDSSENMTLNIEHWQQGTNSRYRSDKSIVKSLNGCP